MYARICSATGWTWEYVGQCMTLPRLYAFIDYWKSAPPVAESVAAFVGIKAPPPRAADAANDTEFKAFLAQAPACKVRLPQ